LDTSLAALSVSIYDFSGLVAPGGTENAVKWQVLGWIGLPKLALRTATIVKSGGEKMFKISKIIR
jgi:hypothetical protein